MLWIIRLITSYVATMMFWAWWAAREKIRAADLAAGRPIPAQTQFILDIFFIACILVAIWFVHAMVASPIKKRQKLARQMSKE